MKKVAVVIKLSFILAVILSQNWLLQTVGPMIAVDLAMNQISNSENSSLGIQLYHIVVNNLWLLPGVLTLVLFSPELVNLVLRLRDAKQNVGPDCD